MIRSLAASDGTSHHSIADRLTTRAQVPCFSGFDRLRINSPGIRPVAFTDVEAAGNGHSVGRGPTGVLVTVSMVSAFAGFSSRLRRSASFARSGSSTIKRQTAVFIAKGYRISRSCVNHPIPNEPRENHQCFARCSSSQSSGVLALASHAEGTGSSLAIMRLAASAALRIF